MRTEPANVFWVGGPAAAGKSTVSRLLARKHGFLWYSVDARSFAHEKRAVAAGSYVPGTDPGALDRRPMIIEDIESLPVETSVIVEGAFVTPAMAGTGENAVWLMPSQKEQVARVEHRNPGADHSGLIWGWNLVHGQLEGTGANVVVVDGQSVEETITAVERAFGATFESGPAARTTGERRALLRVSNGYLAENTRRRTVHAFDCECAQETCTAVVDLHVDELPSLLAAAPPSIVAPGHA
ncbi:hypothetical protein [Kribbella sp. NPDC004875]|uniref:hypothetical protein n=1 Tax=Kribbella sp. NPDC004875 TaxID=3364107 RepID=UPI0036894771